MAQYRAGVNRVTYNNLPPGQYTFQVRALNYGNYSETRTVKILITPPWYQTWWAYCVYITLAGLLVLGIVNYILSRMRHRREIMKREHAEQLMKRSYSSLSIYPMRYVRR